MRTEVVRSAVITGAGRRVLSDAVRAERGEGDGQAVDQTAGPKTALDAQAKRRARHAEREKRLERLAVQVLVAARERDQQIGQIEIRAGDALAQMTSEGVGGARPCVVVW